MTYEACKIPYIFNNDLNPKVDLSPWTLCATGNHTVLKKLHEQREADGNPIDYNEPDDVGNSPLIWAARNGRIECLKWAHEHGGDINTTGYNKMTALHHAINTMNENCMEYLISNGADCAAKDDNGSTPLHLGACRGVLNLVTAPIDGGCDINVANNRDITPLMLAISNGHISCVHKLVTLKAKVNGTKDKNGDTPLHYACRAGMTSIAKYLVDSSSADMEATNKKRQKPEDVCIFEATKKIFDRSDKAAKKRKVRKKKALL